ncbi:TPR-like protein [Ceratobasidium sp. AG-I]|nr:TPR-like protein [Ceratobasidium sp. AG-I]
MSVVPDSQDEWSQDDNLLDDASEESGDSEDLGYNGLQEGRNVEEVGDLATNKDGVNNSADMQIRGDFDRLMEEIKITNDSAQSLGEAWDFTIADNDADNFDLQNELREATGIGKRSKGKGRARGPRRVHVSQEVKYFIGQANAAYAAGDRAAAIKIFQDVIAIEPGIASTWTTLAMCHEEEGDEVRGLQLRIMAAHLEGDVETWIELGLRSREIGSMEQSLYCYRNAARLDKVNPDVLWDYAFCLRESGQIQKAIKTYEAILRILPHDLTVLTQLRDLLVQSGDLARATELYSNAFEHYLSSSRVLTAPSPQDGIIIDPLLAFATNPTGNDDAHGFGTVEIASLADLLSGLGRHDRAIDVVMRGAQWLGQVVDFDGSNTGRDKLDVNLRMRLAVAELRLGDIESGKKHASIILAYDSHEFYELHTELADLYFEIGSFVDALGIYEQLATQSYTSSLYVLSQVGACYRRMANYPLARDIYMQIVEAVPNENGAKMELAQIYEIMGEKQLALDLVNEVIRAREENQSRMSTSEPPTAADASLFAERGAPNPNASTSAGPKKPTIKPAEMQRLERERTDAVQRGFKKLATLDAGDVSLAADDEVMGRWDDWVDEADAVANIFMEERKLFIADRYKGFSGLKRRTRKDKADDEGDIGIPGPSGSGTAATNYRGIRLTEWLRFLIKYSFVITKHKGRYQDAIELLNKLTLSNAYQEWKKHNSIRFALLAIAVHERDYPTITDYARKLMIRYHMNNDALRFLLASLGGGITAAEAFLDSTLQKFLFREMSLFERAAKGEPAVFVGGGRNRWDFNGGKGGNEEDGDADGSVAVPRNSAASAAASNPTPVLPTQESPVYITAYSQISGAARSYQTAIYYLFRAYDLEPNDPVICLSLGAACIGRAMQRQSDNRNHMVTQGFAFLSKYRSMRAEVGPLQAEEVEYNLGRGFQQLGLQAFAEKHYKAVLESVDKRRKEDPDAPLGIAKETAYNLSLIYVVSGSPTLARDLYRNWLSF